MNDSQNMDFYEILEISPNASQDTIDRMFRFLAQRYHPDRPETANSEKFDHIVKAHDTLRDPEKRAAYDIKHKKNSESQWHLLEEAGDMDSFESDDIIQKRVLSVMYVKRKRNMYSPGCGTMELERLTGCPREMLDFHLWYLREKGWILRLEDGLLAIAADGVDKILSVHHTDSHRKMLTDEHKQ